MAPREIDQWLAARLPAYEHVLAAEIKRRRWQWRSLEAAAKRLGVVTTELAPPFETPDPLDDYTITRARGVKVRWDVDTHGTAR